MEDKKLKLIIADVDQNIVVDTKEVFENDGKYEVVATCKDGNDLTKLISQKSPEVLIMDLALSGKDGFEVLEDIKNMNKDVTIVIHSEFALNGFINRAISLGAKYYCIKPMDLNLLKKRVDELIEEKNNPTPIINKEVIEKKDLKSLQIDKKITEIFITVGIPANIKGYQFLREAVKLAIASPTIINSITKKLYPSIAEKFDTSASKVERAIRHAIEVAWDRQKIENINNVFGIKVYNSNEKPTNGEFIALVADKMMLDYA